MSLCQVLAHLVELLHGNAQVAHASAEFLYRWLEQKKGIGGNGSTAAQIGRSLTRQQQIATSQQYIDTRYICVLIKKLN